MLIWPTLLFTPNQGIVGSLDSEPTYLPPTDIFDDDFSCVVVVVVVFSTGITYRTYLPTPISEKSEKVKEGPLGGNSYLLCTCLSYDLRLRSYSLWRNYFYVMFIRTTFLSSTQYRFGVVINGKMSHYCFVVITIEVERKLAKLDV